MKTVQSIFRNIPKIMFGFSRQRNQLFMSYMILKMGSLTWSQQPRNIQNFKLHWSMYSRVQWFSLFSYFWEYLPFPLYLGTQEFRKCLKKLISLQPFCPNFFGLFQKSIFFPIFSILIFEVSIKQIFTKFSENHLW